MRDFQLLRQLVAANTTLVWLPFVSKDEYPLAASPRLNVPMWLGKQEPSDMLRGKTLSCTV